MSIYDYQVKDTKNNLVSLEQYRGKVLLVVNTATGCGFTPQYKELQELYEKYSKSGLEILDFPCNQFNNQAPGTEEEIVSFCELNYGVTFPQFAKIEVNGEHEDPFFHSLKNSLSNLRCIPFKTSPKIKFFPKPMRCPQRAERRGVFCNTDRFCRQASGGNFLPLKVPAAHGRLLKDLPF